MTNSQSVWPQAYSVTLDGGETHGETGRLADWRAGGRTSEWVGGQTDARTDRRAGGPTDKQTEGKLRNENMSTLVSSLPSFWLALLALTMILCAHIIKLCTLCLCDSAPTFQHYYAIMARRTTAKTAHTRSNWHINLVATLGVTFISIQQSL